MLIVAGGTGILPFVDLLNFLLKKAITLALSTQGKDASWIKPQQDYARQLGKLRFNLCCSFRSLDDFVNIETVRELVRLNDQHNLNLFRVWVRLDKGETDLPRRQEYFDKEFYSSILGNPEHVHEVLVCGPERMCVGTYAILHKTMKLPSHKILFV